MKLTALEKALMDDDEYQEWLRKQQSFTEEELEDYYDRVKREEEVWQVVYDAIKKLFEEALCN
jgi:uncharacterized protein (UPF0335 family)